MFKTILLVAVCLAVFSLWKRSDSKVKRNVASVAQSDGGTVVVSYFDARDLVVQLKAVKPGQKFELRCIGSNQVAQSTGVLCSDKAGVAAMMERDKREREELNRALQAEFHRIQNVR